MRRHLLLSESRFADAIADIAGRVAETARALQGVVSGGEGAASAGDSVRATDRRVEGLLRDLDERIETSFVTDLDRSAARALGAGFGVASRRVRHAVVQAEILGPAPELSVSARLCDCLVRDTEALAAGTRHLADHEAVSRCCGELRVSKSDGDDAYYAALGSLFDQGLDPIDVLKQKAVLDRVYAAVVACRRCGDALEEAVSADA
jgi:hypothetical protein